MTTKTEYRPVDWRFDWTEYCITEHDQILSNFETKMNNIIISSNLTYLQKDTLANKAKEHLDYMYNIRKHIAFDLSSKFTKSEVISYITSYLTDTTSLLLDCLKGETILSQIDTVKKCTKTLVEDMGNMVIQHTEDFRP